MKILALNGGPRGESGSTHALATEFLKGCEEAGASVEYVMLVSKDVRQCHGCFKCMSNDEGVCVIKDDVEELITKIIESDLLVFATPLYADNVSGLMKNFMDRLLPLVTPYLEDDKSGMTIHKKRYDKYPKIAVISNCARPERDNFDVIKLLFKRLARNMHSVVVGEVYASEGELLTSNNFFVKPFVKGYLKNVKKAGSELVKAGRISEDTGKKLSSLIVPKSVYVSFINRYWNNKLNK